ncbi:MAG: hypothetical protein LCH93_28030 [Proteobacteria bacterium]|nr:hypothetical protein [Pseudomonadota bacterium]
MSDWVAYWAISGGVLVGVLHPVLLGFIRKQFPPTAGSGFPPWAKKYGGLFVFCLVTALIVLAVWKNANPDARLEWFTAFLLGYGWEAFVEKWLRGTPPA